MYKKTSLVLGLIIILIIAFNLIGQIFTTLKSGDRLNELQTKNNELKARLVEVGSSEFIEEQARDKLGLAKDGEVVIVIPDEKIDAILGNKKQEEAKLSNYLGWWKVFF